MQTRALDFLNIIRRKMSEDNKKIADHRFLKNVEDGILNLTKIRLFATQQYYIVNYDLRSLAKMLVKSTSKNEADFFYMLVTGDKEAFEKLLVLCSELGLTEDDMTSSKILPRAVAYTHYLSWLAEYATAGEQAIALTVNLPVWGNACGRLGKALKDRYSIKNTGFFELFFSPFNTVDAIAVRIMDRYLNQYSLHMERCARLIQGYELMFWDSIYEDEMS